MALEALNSKSLDQVTESNYVTVLNLLAVDYTKNDKAFTQAVITKFDVSPAMILALFDRTVATEFVPEAQIRKAGKNRQDTLYKQVRYSSSHENPVAFAELLAYCTSSPDWEGISRLIGLYSLDPISTLGILLDSFIACKDVPKATVKFATIFKSSVWKTEHLTDVIGWRLWHENDWRETLKFATGLIQALLTFDDIYTMLGSDSTYTSKIQNHWEDELSKQAGASQFMSLANAGSLDGPSGPKGPEFNHLEHRQYFVEYLLESGHVDDAFRIINNFPLIVQMNPKVSEFIIGEILVKPTDNTFKNNVEALTLCGPLIGLNIKLIDILCNEITEMSDKESLETFRQWLLPAISLAQDTEVVDRIWSVLSTFTQEQRYELYTEWQFSVPRYYKPVKYALLKAERGTKGILKRVSNENAVEMLALFAGQAKINPYTAFSVFLSQVEAYDKIGSLMLDQLSDITDMAWDVLPLAVLVQLSSGRQQQQGLYDSKWIQALSSFIARLAARAPKFDSSKLVLFVLKQFHQSNFSNIIIFRDLFLHMGGCMQLNELSINQIELLSSHKSAREILMKQLGAPDPSKETTDRLLSALKDNEVILELFVALCYGYRNALPKSPDEEIGTPKLLSHRLDDFTLVIQQYCTLLAKLPMEEFPLLVDPIPTLLEKYGVPVPMAMALWRPYIFEKVSKDDYDVEKNALHPQLVAITQDLPDISAAFSKEFYLTSWTLETFEIQKFERLYTELSPGYPAVKLGSKIHTHTLSKTNKRLEHEQMHWLKKPAQRGQEGLTRRKAQLDILTKVILPRALFSNADALFCGLFINKLCRMGTPYFSFMSFLDTLFNESLIYNTMCSCTAYEAENFGIFLDTIFYWLHVNLTPAHFKSLSSLCNSNGELSVSAALLRQRDLNPGTRESNIDATFSRREIFTASEKWQRQLTRVLSAALKSKEYMVLRNAITVIKVGQNDIFRQTGEAARIQKQVEGIAKAENRADIKLAATALVGQLAKAVKAPRLSFRSGDDARAKSSNITPRTPEDSRGRDNSAQLSQSREPVSEAQNKGDPSPPTPASNPALDLIDQRLKRDREPSSANDVVLPDRPKARRTGYRGGNSRDDDDRDERGNWNRDDRERRFRRDRGDRSERNERSDHGGRNRNDRDRGDGRGRNSRDRGDRGRSDRERGERELDSRDRGERGDRGRSDRDRGERELDSRERGSRDRRDRRDRNDRGREPPLPPPSGLPPRRDYNRNW